MERTLDNNSVIPLYHQLKEILKENIENGTWSPGDTIPSENQLMQEFNISRNTAKKAIEDLVREGALVRVQGRGTFVSRPKFEQSLSGFYSFSKVMKERGLEPKDVITILKETKSKPSVARYLKLMESEPVIQLERVRYAQDEPMILETSYLPKKYVEGITKEMLEQNSLYDLMAKEYSVYVTSAREVFEPVLIRDYESKFLDVEEGYPALLLERIAYDPNNNPVEYCRSIVRGDRCKFYTELL
jgi:GntR family transcriptional regulator